MGGPNLEIFKFGMYIMFPVGFMYYFGTNLDARFAVPDFWPKPGQTHTIPFEREEIAEELERLKQRRLAVRAQRLEMEKQGLSAEITTHQDREARVHSPEILAATKLKIDDPADAGAREGGSGKGWFSWSK